MNDTSRPSPDLFFDTLTGYQKSAALKAALDLGVFTAIGEGQVTALHLAAQCRAAERGIRILCDYLTIHGFLLKQGDRYRSTRDSAFFLNEKSPAYAGRAAEFLLSDELMGAFKVLTESVRKGGTARSKEGSIAPEHPMWVAFAQTMGGMMLPASQRLADLVGLDAQRAGNVLDVAAGHGVWGISVAKKFPLTQLVALDWAPVLEITRANARAFGVEPRFSTIAGDAFKVELGTDYEAVLIPNFLHHFNRADCVRFLQRVYRALRAGGRTAIVEFIPNADRVSPPSPAAFSMAMLATTPEGDAYTFDELAGMLGEAGFQRPAAHELPASVNQAVIATK